MKHPPPEAFLLPITVQPADIDEFDHVNNVVYVRWMQDVAAAQWASLASEELRAEMYWVVVRHEIDYHRPARLGEDVHLRTWLGPVVNGLFERFTHISRAERGVVLARGRSVWCPMSFRNGRRLRELPAEADRLLAAMPSVAASTPTG